MLLEGALATRLSGPSVAKASVHGFQERTIDGARVLVAFRDITWKSGSQTAHVDALVIGQGGTFSVVSDAGRVEWASNNFSGFLPRIIDLAMLVPAPK